MHHRIGVYKYRLLAPIDWDMDCREQLFRRNALWNALVELDRQHRTRYQELLAAHPQVAPFEAELAALRQRHAQLRGERKKLKAGDGVRSNKQRIGQISLELKDLARQMQLLANRLKQIRKELREELSPQLRDLSACPH